MKNFKKTLIISIATLIPVLMLASFCFFIPPQYSKTFLGELSHKYQLLSETDEPKIIMVGGSSLAFGLDSKTLSEHMNMPVVNFGLYASLGTKVMLDLSRANINKGDIIVVAPELDEQTLSLYFNAESMWQALDSDFSMLRHVSPDDYADLFGGLINYVGAKALLWTSGEELNPVGDYHRDSFNEYGDINYPRPYNKMLLGYDPNKRIVLEPSIYSEDFIDYLNEYVAYATGRGATVYYSFPPMNATALSPDADEDSILEFYRFVCRNLDCEVISDVNDYLIEENYFFDSNLHLNDSGVVLRTALLIKDLWRTLGSAESLKIEIPPAPDRPTIVIGDGSEDVWAQYYTYSEFVGVAGDTVGYVVTGVTEQGRELVKLEIPTVYEGLPVITIAAEALKDCSALTDLTIRSNIISIESGAFAGAASLKRLHIYNEDEMSMSVSQSALFDGASSDITICLYTKKSFDSYSAGYYWGNYSSMMQFMG